MKVTIALVVALALAVGCKSEPRKKPTTVKPAASAKADESKPAKAEGPAKPAEESKLNPNSPREKFLLVAKKGQKEFDRIYREREAMLTKLGKVKLPGKKDLALLEPLGAKLLEFGIGEEPKELETAPARVCKIIKEVRVPAESLIAKGEERLLGLRATEKEYEAKADAIYQKQWDKLEKEISVWSKPVHAGKQVLWVLKSILDEAYLIAEFGPRRAQLALAECLTEIAKTPLKQLDAQRQLEKVIERTRRYW